MFDESFSTTLSTIAREILDSTYMPHSTRFFPLQLTFGTCEKLQFLPEKCTSGGFPFSFFSFCQINFYVSLGSEFFELCQKSLLRTFMELTDYEIPPLPGVTLLVLKFDPTQETADSSQLERIISPDKAICTDLLRVSNSAFYGRSGRVKSLKDAINLIGLKAVKNLVLLMITRRMNPTWKGQTIRKYLNAYPVLCALISMDLANRFGLKKIEDEVFLSGLLHKIGMTIIAMKKKEHYEMLMEEVEKNGYDILKLEEKAYSVNHVDVGRQAVSLWKLPEDLGSLIQEFGFDPATMADHKDAVRIVTLAGLLTGKFLSADITDDPFEKEAKIFEYYKVAVPDRNVFNEEYFKGFEKHPFYEYSMAM